MTITVFTNGVFDLLHVGHMRLLAFAKSHGNRLIVGLNSDSSVGRIKGSQRPILNQDERREMLLHLKWVDDVVIFDADSPMELIRQLRPDILVKGSDWKGKSIRSQAVIESWGGRVVIAENSIVCPTTDILERIREKLQL